MTRKWPNRPPHTESVAVGSFGTKDRRAGARQARPPAPGSRGLPEGLLRELIINSSRWRSASRCSSTAASRSSRSSASPTTGWSAASTRAGSRTSTRGLQGVRRHRLHEGNAFLHYWDMLPAAAAPRSRWCCAAGSQAGRAAQGNAVKDIPGLYPPGTDIVIQVTKGPIGTKGPRTTTSLSIPGHLILTPYSDGCGISPQDRGPHERHRQDPDQRADHPRGDGRDRHTRRQGRQEGPVFASATSTSSEEYWEEIAQKMSATRPLPASTPSGSRRAHRARLLEEMSRVLIDDRSTSSAPRARPVSSPSGPSPRSPTATASRSSSASTSAADRADRPAQGRALPSGGEIIVDETEALIAIDINTGSQEPVGDEKNTIPPSTSRRPAKAARQIQRLRSLGG